LTVSSTPTGNQPRLCNAWIGVPLLTTEQRITKVVTEQSMQVVMTEAMRPFMTEGASREEVGEGRVVFER